MWRLSHLAHVIDAIIDVFGTVFSGETWQTVASVVGEVVHTFPAIFARGKFVGAKWNFCLAVLAREAAAADASVLADAVNAS